MGRYPHRSNEFHQEVLRLMEQREKELGRLLNQEEAQDMDNEWAERKLTTPKIESTASLAALMQEPPLGGSIRSEANEAIRSRQFKDLEDAHPTIVTNRATPDDNTRAVNTYEAKHHLIGDS